jgi:hypothetical protein
MVADTARHAHNSLPGGGDACWHCTIKLRLEYDGATGARLPRVTEQVFTAKHLEDKDEVELWIMRAQKALLNPSRQPATFQL